MEKKKTGKLDQILDKLGEHDGRFDGIDTRLDRIESGLNMQAKKLLEHDTKFDLHDRNLNEMHKNMLSHFDKIYGNWEWLGKEYPLINKALKRIEDNLLPRLETVEKTVGII